MKCGRLLEADGRVIIRDDGTQAIQRIADNGAARMDMVDILGGLLRKKAGAAAGGSSGGSILKDILGGGGGRSAPRSADNTPSLPQGFPRIGPSPDDSEPEFSSLDDFLKNAHTSNPSSGSNRAAAPTTRPQAPVTKPSFPAVPNRPAPPASPLPPAGRVQRPQPNPRPAEFPIGQPDPNARAEILVRAMINAAKADGQVDQQEQDAIVKQCGDLTQDDVRWLQTEFAAPLNIPEFVWSVPLGMEQEVYAISLMAMNLDNNAEALYLRDLSHGFRMTLAVCNRIHQQYGAPQIGVRS